MTECDDNYLYPMTFDPPVILEELCEEFTLTDPDVEPLWDCPPFLRFLELRG